MRIRYTLNLAEAAAAARAGCEAAAREQWAVTIAVVDEAGTLIHLSRMDDASAASVTTAIEKARTAAMTGLPTKTIEAMVKDRPALLSMNRVVVEGGLPILHQGQKVGGIGVSGVQSHQDAQVASAASSALKPLLLASTLNNIIGIAPGPPTMSTNKPSQFQLGGKLAVNRLGFGAMRISTNGFRGPARDPEAGRAVLRRAVQLGVNLIDTADFYQSSDGTVRANRLIREALHPYPSDLVIATKVGPVFLPDGSHRHGTGADMRRLVEGNLENLGLDRLDLVYLRIGEMAPPEGESLAERFAALAALREEGLIRHLGLSNVTAAHLAEARSIAPVAAVQNNFHVAQRNDAALLETCAAAGIGFSPFFPLGGGRTNIDDGRLARVASRHGATPNQIALAWLLSLSPVMLAIPGTGSIAHLEENMAAAGIVLTKQDLVDLA